ncbi:hypothetical protein AB3X91_09805 [Paraburkholderia sp. BR14263]|uniref:Uncharacterized protein n=1 Tax=Paraburkholderia guartelaensis TaxID=2546446 RepID=A0ABU9SFH3_9BURK
MSATIVLTLDEVFTLSRNVLPQGMSDARAEPTLRDIAPGVLAVGACRLSTG